MRLYHLKKFHVKPWKPYTQKNNLCFMTNINLFKPCLKSDLSRLVNEPAGDIGYSKVIISKPAPGKSLGQLFRGLKTLAQLRVRTSDRQLYGLTFIPLHHLGLRCFTK